MSGKFTTIFLNEFLDAFLEIYQKNSPKDLKKKAWQEILNKYISKVFWEPCVEFQTLTEEFLMIFLKEFLNELQKSS